MSPPRLLDGIEVQMAEAAAKMAAMRHRAIEALAAEIAAERARVPDWPFPGRNCRWLGILRRKRVGTHRGDAEFLRKFLANSRERDRAAGRTLVGPHRSDLEVTHGPKAMPAKMCSTGEQKALLVGLALAQARLVKEVAGGIAPLILLDEIAAHLDEDRRAALFASIASLNAQVWMTGTDSAMFVPLRDATEVQFFRVSEGLSPHKQCRIRFESPHIVQPKRDGPGGRTGNHRWNQQQDAWTRQWKPMARTASRS